LRTVARLIGSRLRSAGIRYVFGVPGGEVVDLMYGFREEGLRFVLTRHECAGAFMADAHGYLTGTPGVCLATLGPGATNLTTGIAHAFLDRSPVIAISAQLPVERLVNTSHQAVDLRRLFEPITKWTYRVSAETAAEAANRSPRRWEN